MPRRRTSPSVRVLRQTADLSWAAPIVIAERLVRMGTAGFWPGVSDRREVERMFTEKVSAFQQSCLAMWEQSLSLQMQVARMCLAPASLVATGRFTGASSRAAVDLSQATARVVSAGLEPVRSKARSNAKRLSRKRSRS